MKDDEKARSIHNQGRKKSPSHSSSIKRPTETCWIDDTAKPRQPEQVLAWQEAIFEGSRDAIFITDVDSRIMAVNEAACVLTGHSKEELLSMRIPDLHEEADLHAYQTYHDRIMAGEETLSEAKIFRKDGSKVDTEFNNRRVVLDGLLYMHTTARDITDRKQVEEKLRESEAKYRLLVDEVSDGFYISDLHGVLTFANRALARMLGFENPQEIVGRNFLDFVPIGKDIKLNKQYQAAMQTGSSSEVIIVEIVRQDGTHAYLEIKPQVSIEGGKPVGDRGIVYDVTERKQVQERLHESEERYRDLVENSHELIYTHDLHGQILSVNHTASLRLGHNPTALVGRNLGELLAPEEKSGFEEYLGRIRRKGSAAGAWVLQGATGERRDWEYHSTLRSDAKQGPYVRGMAHDVTERVRAEEALRDSEETARALLNATSDVAFLLDASGKTLAINDIAASSLGSTTTELLGKNLYEHIPGELAQARREHINRAIETKEIIEFEDQRRGTWFLNRVYPLPDIGNQPKRVAIYAQNITERKQAEEAIQRRNAELTTLNQIGQALNRFVEPSEIFELIFTMIGQVLDNRNLFIALYDQASQRISFPVYTINDERLPEAERPVGNGITDYIIRTNAPLLVRQDLAGALNQRGIDLIGKPSRSFLAVPMHTGDVVIGVIALQDYDHENAYDEHELELLTTVAAQAAIALENTRLYGALQQELDQLKQTKTSLAESEAQLNSIVENTSDMIWAVDSKSLSLLFYNQSFVDYFLHGLGVPVEKGMRPQDLLPTDELSQKWHDLYHRALKEGPYSTEYVMETTMRTLQLSLNLLKKDDTVFGISVFAKNITEQKQAEEALRESEYRYRTVFEGVEDAIFVESLDGRILDANRAASEMYGYSHAEFLNRTVVDLVPSKDYIVAFSPKDNPTLPTHPVETVNLRSNGEEFPIEISIHLEILNEEQVLFVVGRDITERKRTEALLQQSKDFSENLIRTANVIIVSMDLAGKILIFNETAEKITGFSRADMVGKNWFEVLVPKDRYPQVWEEFQQDGGGWPRVYENPILTRAGEARIISWQNNDLQEAGKIVGSISFGIDINERKRAEEALQESEQRYRLLYENSLDSVLLTAPDGSVLSANPAACQMFGRTEAEIRQLGRNGLIDTSDPRLPVALEERTRTGSFKGELTGLRSDGTKFQFELTSSIFTNRTGQPRSSMIIRDISERKRADELLRQSEERYKLMFEQAPLAINITRGTEILYCNPTYISMFGFSSLNEIQRIPPLELFTAEWRPFIQENIRRRSQGLTSPNGYEAECIRKDGTRFPVQMNFVRTMFYDGLATVGFILDITERKRAEAALAASREQLRALSQYLQAAREEERTYIAREIHDELGQSLTALKMDLAWLSRQLPPEQSSLVVKTAAMSDMVDGTIQMVRRVASQLRPGMLDDLGLVAALEWQAGEFQSRTGIACHLDLPENVTVLNQDQATTMFRIFQETLTNISRHAQATRVRIAIKELPGYIELIVRDNGIGITQDQLNDPRSLGLTGMRERVQTFGGSLKIKSTPGKGTSVHVRMPRVNMPMEKES